MSGSSGSASAPPGWPPAVPPSSVLGWQAHAVEWFLDHCPADYRGYAAWRRHPIALAWVATKHITAQVEAMREAYRGARVELGPHLDAAALSDVLGAIESEGLRLRAAAHSAALMTEAMQGKTWVPRL